MVSKIYNQPLLAATTDSGQPVSIRAEPDGTLRLLNSAAVQVHRGTAFSSGFFWNAGNTIANGASAFLLFRPSTEVHFISRVAASGDFDVNFYKLVTFSDAGVVLPILNRNEYFETNLSVATVNHTPTITDFGTQMGSAFLPGGGGFFGGGGGESSTFGSEFVLMAGRNYLMEGFNSSGAAQRIQMTMAWYEI